MQQNPSAVFQLAVPYLLPSSLAALHASRARLLFPSDSLFSATHCAKCGTPLIDNSGQTRSVRKKQRTTVIRTIRRSCRSCSHDEDVPLGVNCAPAFPKPRDRASARCKHPTTTNPPRASCAPSHSPAEMASSPAHPRASQSIMSPSAPGPSYPSSVALTPVHSSKPPMQTTPPTQPQIKTKARHKNKPGLQNMLARNRERHVQEKKHEGGQDAGLSAFLQGL